MPKSLMDWFGIATLWLGAAILALKSGGLALPKGAPAWLASPSWAVIPVVLIGVSAILFAGRAVVQARKQNVELTVEVGATMPNKQPSRSDDSAWPLVAILAIPMIASVAMFGFNAWKERETKRPQPIAEVPPPVLRGYVTQAFIRQTLAKDDPVAIEMILARFLHTPMQATGTVFSKRGQQGYRQYIVDLTPAGSRPRVYLVFDGQKNDLTGYRIDDHISAWCRIERLDKSGIGLTRCTLIEPES